MPTPTEVQAVRIMELEAETQLLSEQVFYLLGALRQAEAELIAAGLRAELLPCAPVGHANPSTAL